MVKSSWSFPTSPRNPAKIPFELRILAPLTMEWKQQGKIWSPLTTQIEFGKALRDFEADKDEEDLEESLAFQKQAEEISEANLAWTARARFGTFKFLDATNRLVKRLLGYVPISSNTVKVGLFMAAGE